jgi:hypothetical protein
MSRLVAAVLACLLLLAGCRADPSSVHADLCADLGHLEQTVEDLATYGNDTRIAVVRSSLEKMDPTFGNLSRSGLSDPAVVDRLLRAHVGYRDLVAGVGDDETYVILGPAAPPAAAEFRAAFRAAVADLGCER